MAREAIAIPWRELAQSFRRMEDRGEVRGGRFVHGFVGEQFALPDAVERLREIRRTPSDGRLIAISAADPLNLTGIVTVGERAEDVFLVDGARLHDEQALLKLELLQRTGSFKPRGALLNLLAVLLLVFSIPCIQKFEDTDGDGRAELEGGLELLHAVRVDGDAEEAAAAEQEHQDHDDEVGADIGCGYFLDVGTAKNGLDETLLHEQVAQQRAAVAGRNHRDQPVEHGQDFFGHAVFAPAPVAEVATPAPVPVRGSGEKVRP